MQGFPSVRELPTHSKGLSLKPDIQKDVIKARPESLVEAFALTQFYEKEEMSMDIVSYSPFLPYKAISNWEALPV